MLGQHQVEGNAARALFHQPLQKKGIEQVFEIPPRGVASHFPGGEFVQPDAELLLHAFRLGHFGTKQMNLMAAFHHFLDQIHRFSRSAAGGRIKGLVREKSDVHS